MKRIDKLGVQAELDMIAEVIAWLASRFVIPAYLGAARFPYSVFVHYSFGASLLVGTGVLLTSPAGSFGPIQGTINYLKCWIALFCFGSIVYAAGILGSHI